MRNQTRIRITVQGAVQGVGFRPFVYRLATELGLAGWVSNSMQGVVIEAEGPKNHLDSFLVRIGSAHPRNASIYSMESSFLDPVGYRTFEIRSSQDDGPKGTLILPDIATCTDCLSEIFDPADRRYRYPFTNCTNCGPRFTIVESIPYDRAHTSMREFTMCTACRCEYENPMDRRFHAQPNACPDCGPQVELWNPLGKVLATHDQAILLAAQILKSGKIVAVKGLGGFQLMTHASQEVAVQRLRRRKHREEKPFALMAPSLEWAHRLCAIAPLEERLLFAPESPIVLLPRRNPAEVAEAVAPRNPYLGIMLPYTPLHHLLMREMDRPVVATSGNRTDEPIAIDEREALERLGNVADAFLVHNRPIVRHADDSVVRVLLGREQLLRRARGYAPLPIVIKQVLPPTLAAGPHLKNAIALTRPDDAKNETCIFVSQHIGDLENPEAFDAFRRVLDDFQNLHGVKAGVVTCDLHPDYASTQYASSLAEERHLPLVRVQHHWAHIVSCMVENGIESPALGVAWDGTGYGLDHTIWGGEFLQAVDGSFRRAAHFRTFPLPGADTAIKKPRQAAIGLLYTIFGDAAFDGTEPPLLRQMLQKGIQTPRTSSVGRLFDAVSAITGICGEASFEGQAAMELEFAVDPGINDHYTYDVVHLSDEPFVVDWEPMIREIVSDAQKQIAPSIIATRFHNTLAEIIVDVARRVGETRVILTGGCFQNRYLTEVAVRGLTAAGFLPYWHQRIPPNDGGIAIGQAVGAHWAEQEQDRSRRLIYVSGDSRQSD